MVLLEPSYECASLAALPGLCGYRNRAQHALLGKRLVITNRDAIPGLHTATQGAERILTLREFRNGDCALCVWRAVQRG